MPTAQELIERAKLATEDAMRTSFREADQTTFNDLMPSLVEFTAALYQQFCATRSSSNPPLVPAPDFENAEERAAITAALDLFVAWQAAVMRKFMAGKLKPRPLVLRPTKERLNKWGAAARAAGFFAHEEWLLSLADKAAG